MCFCSNNALPCVTGFRYYRDCAVVQKECKLLGPDGIKTVGLQLNGWKFWWFFPELFLLFRHALFG